MTKEEQTRTVLRAFDILKERGISVKMVVTGKRYDMNEFNEPLLWVPLYSPKIDFIFSDEYERMVQALREGIIESYENEIKRLKATISERLSNIAESQKGGAE